MLKTTGSWLVSVLMLCVFGSLILILPANANAISNDSQLVSLIAPIDKPAMFDPNQVRLGITPTGWSNSDDPSIDLVPSIPYQQILSEMALAGYKGSQMSGKYPHDMATLKKELELRDFTISEPWVGTYFTVDDDLDSQKIFHQQMEFMQEIGGNSIVVAELGGAVHQQPIAPLPNRPIYSDRQWDKLTKGLNKLGKEAYEAGMELCYHPHVGTGVETLADIDRLMAGTNPKYLKLLLDTGHLYYAGVDPLVVAQKYGDRIKHVHLKNIRQDVLQRSIKQGLSFLDSIREGAFTVPGDQEGIIDFKPIFTALAKANYQGWLVVEAEQDPNKANPLEYALMARNYLRQETGL